MNREDIIRMAREASNTPIDHHATPDLFGVAQIERFFQAAYAAGAAAEREACALECEDGASTPEELLCAKLIRARGQQ